MIVAPMMLISDIKCFFSTQDRDEARDATSLERRPGKHDLYKKGDAHHRDQSNDKGLHAPHAEPLQIQQQEGIEYGDTDAVNERQTP